MTKGHSKEKVPPFKAHCVVKINGIDFDVSMKIFSCLLSVLFHSKKKNLIYIYIYK